MMTVAVAAYGLTLMNLVPSILKRMDGMQYAGLVGLFISLGITLMATIGGKLSDIFGRGAVDNFAPIGAQMVIKSSVTLSGSMQLPKTLLTMFLPAIAGIWMAKKKTNMWKAMFIATLLFALPLLIMGFTMPVSWYIWVYIAAITITGIAESYRGISFTAGAQSCLNIEDFGVGTSMVNFANSLSASIAAAVYSAIYGLFTASGTSVTNIQKGVNGVFLTAGLVTVVGVIIVLAVIRPMFKREEKAELAEPVI